MSVFHKYELFQRLGQNKLASGTLNWRELRNAVEDSEGPSQKLTHDVIDTVFYHLKNNLEFNGLDFKQFFLLMSSLDFIYIYGKEENGLLDLAEW